MRNPSRLLSEIQEAISVDGWKVRVDVDGVRPIGKVAKMAHNSGLSAIEVSHNALDILSTIVESWKGMMMMAAVAHTFGELYRRGFEIQPTKYLSASGNGMGIGTASASS